MQKYLNTLIVLAVICHIAVIITPGSESSRKSVRLVCALALLAALLSPVKALINGSGEVIEKVKNYIDGMQVSEYEKTYEEGEYAEFADVLMSLLSERYKINDAKITLVGDDESGSIREIQIYSSKCPYITKERIKKELSEECGIPVYVFGTGGKENGGAAIAQNY